MTVHTTVRIFLISVCLMTATQIKVYCAEAPDTIPEQAINWKRDEKHCLNFTKDPFAFPVWQSVRIIKIPPRWDVHRIIPRETETYVFFQDLDSWHEQDIRLLPFSKTVDKLIGCGSPHATGMLIEGGALKYFLFYEECFYLFEHDAEKKEFNSIEYVPSRNCATNYFLAYQNKFRVDRK